MKIRRNTAFVAIAIFLSFIFNSNAQRALFEPDDGRVLLVIGQDMGAIGGFAAPNNNGYVDHISVVPGGVTTYLALPRLAGLETRINHGAGYLCAQSILDNPIYAHSALAIGLYFVNQENKVAQGALDSEITRLGNWIKTSNRPVLLRIGYEFDGHWNHYDPVAYKKAFQRIVTLLRGLQVKNCAMVWQACTSPFNHHKDIAQWYPGDDYVDWMGYSWFLSSPKQIELTDELVGFARAHKKPVMVCESAPQGYDTARLTHRNLSSGKEPKTVTPDTIWNDWYIPYFDYLEKNKDAIKIVAYINANWDAQLMWGYPYWQGYWGDSRVEANDYLKTKWLETTSQQRWMHASPSLFSELGFTPAPPAQSPK